MAPPAGEAVVSPVRSAPTQERPDANFSTNVRKNDRILTILVAKDSTLRQLSLIYLGRYDQEAIGEISRINPTMTDPEHIRAGEQLRLPLTLRRELASQSGPASRTASAIPTRNVRDATF